MHLSINQLSEITGKDRRTIKQRLKDLAHVDGERGAYLYESAEALELIYLSTGKTLDEARKEQALAQAALNRTRDEVERRRRIPLDMILAASDQILQSITAELKAAKSKSLTEDLINSLLDKFRAIPAKLKL